jgi:hypothetical protein
MNAKTYDNTNRGVLFKNEDKQDERDPDYTGQINVGGVECWLDAWINTAKTSGKKFMSMRAKPKQAQDVKGGAKNPPAPVAAEDDWNDEIPF